MSLFFGQKLLRKISLKKTIVEISSAQLFDLENKFNLPTVLEIKINRYIG